MSGKVFGAIILLGLLSIAAVAQKKNAPKANRTVTLMSRTANPDRGRAFDLSVYSFRYALRGDEGKEKTLNNYELQYGNLNHNGDSDWFSVTMVTDDRSRIRDLGKLELEDVKTVPYIDPVPVPNTPVRYDDEAAMIPARSNWRIARVNAGHVYLLRSKDGKTDSYVVFRVEKLVPGKEVTISWKSLKAPKKPIIID